MCWLNAIIGWSYQHPELAAGLLTAVILLAALIIAISTLGAMRRDRAMTIALTLSQAYDTGVILEGRTLLRFIRNKQQVQGIQDVRRSFLQTVNRYKQEYPREFMHLTSVPGFFDLIGWLVRHKCCTTRAIDALLDWQEHYEIWEPYIRQCQNKEEGQSLDDNPNAYYGNFVWLVREIQKQQRQRSKSLASRLWSALSKVWPFFKH